MFEVVPIDIHEVSVSDDFFVSDGLFMTNKKFFSPKTIVAVLFM